jgi:hypothetical protein
MNVPTCEYSKEQGVVKELALCGSKFLQQKNPAKHMAGPLKIIEYCSLSIYQL